MSLLILVLLPVVKYILTVTVEQDYKEMLRQLSDLKAKVVEQFYSWYEKLYKQKRELNQESNKNAQSITMVVKTTAEDQG